MLISRGSNVKQTYEIAKQNSIAEMEDEFVYILLEELLD
jgi:hypothetical protein